MTLLRYIDRNTQKECTELIYGQSFIEIFYGTSWISKILSKLILPFIATNTLFSYLYGAFQKSGWSRKKIKPFIQKFGVDTSEFLDPVDSFLSFNDFFIRKLKPECRPIAPERDIIVLPADGRSLVYDNISQVEGFWIKGHKFSLEEFLGNHEWTQNYAQGAMAIIRLAPVDYHRFHFPVNCLPQNSISIDGSLYSVNPLALKKNIHILSRNKRVITFLQTKSFGKIAYVEIGATNVGSIHQTFSPGEPYGKGDEKGYFSFGGSCIVLLFEAGTIEFSQDLLDASCRTMETLGKMGQPLGRALNP